MNGRLFSPACGSAVKNAVPIQVTAAGLSTLAGKAAAEPA
jgi:hypothetical protein